MIETGAGLYSVSKSKIDSKFTSVNEDGTTVYYLKNSKPEQDLITYIVDPSTGRPKGTKAACQKGTCVVRSGRKKK